VCRPNFDAIFPLADSPSIRGDQAGQQACSYATGTAVHVEEAASPSCLETTRSTNIQRAWARMCESGVSPDRGGLILLVAQHVTRTIVKDVAPLTARYESVAGATEPLGSYAQPLRNKIGQIQGVHSLRIAQGAWRTWIRSGFQCMPGRQADRSKPKKLAHYGTRNCSRQ